MSFEERVEFLTQSIESHDRRIGEITDKVDKVTEAVAKLVEVTSQDAIAIGALARIAESHDRRITDIEGSRHKFGNFSGHGTLDETAR